MVSLYKYIFYKAYFFCSNVLKEKESPQYFASGVVTLALVTNLVIVLEIIEYSFLPNRINIFGNYHGYFAVIFWLLLSFYLNQSKRYVRILNFCKDLKNDTRKNLYRISLIYLLALFIGFFLMGALLREYNINNPPL